MSLDKASDIGTRTTQGSASDGLLARIGLPLPHHAGYRLLSKGDSWYHLGDTLVRQGRPEAALAAFEQALALAPNKPDVMRAVVAVLAGLKRHKAAMTVLACQPTSAETLSLQASLHIELGEPDLALAKCDEALRIDPRHFSAQLTRGAVLRALRRMDDAVANDTALVQQHPNHPVAHYNLGDALLATADYEHALVALNHSLTLAPNNPQTQMARALALAMLQRLDEADQLFQSVRKKFPDALAAYLANAARAAGKTSDAVMPDDVRLIYLSMVMDSQSVCAWAQRAHTESQLPIWAGDASMSESGWNASIAYNSLLFDIDPTVQAQIAARAAAVAERSARHWNTTWFSKHRTTVTPGSRRLRIGFLSPDFRPHPVGDSHWRQLLLHDRARFEVFTYSLRDAAPSTTRQRIVEASDHFVELGSFTAEVAAQRIAADGIDILVDLSGYTDFTHPEILAARPAPLQVQHMGTPGTSGGSFIDYRITDLIVNPPETSAEWTEKLVWLPDTFWLTDDTLPIAAPLSRQACDLPDDAFVFCCFNTHQKLEPDSFRIWMRLLQQISGSVLWLNAGSASSRANLRREAARAGIAAERLIFAPHIPKDQHLARHRCADLFLDTFIYNAHVTALNAWYAGLPVLTHLGRHMAGRMGASAAFAMGCPELVTHSHTQYEATALDLATHPTRLADLRQRIQRECKDSPLFDTERRVRDIELAFEQMWARHCGGLPPASFEVLR